MSRPPGTWNTHAVLPCSCRYTVSRSVCRSTRSLPRKRVTPKTGTEPGSGRVVVRQPPVMGTMCSSGPGAATRGSRPKNARASAPLSDPAGSMAASSRADSARPRTQRSGSATLGSTCVAVDDAARSSSRPTARCRGSAGWILASAVRSGRLMSTLVVPNPTSLLPSPSRSRSKRACTAVAHRERLEPQPVPARGDHRVHGVLDPLAEPRVGVPAPSDVGDREEAAGGDVGRE